MGLVWCQACLDIESLPLKDLFQWLTDFDMTYSPLNVFQLIALLKTFSFLVKIILSNVLRQNVFLKLLELDVISKKQKL